jgi:hypothetical protein
MPKKAPATTINTPLLQAHQTSAADRAEFTPLHHAERGAPRIEQSPLRGTMHLRESRTTTTTIITPLHQAGGEHCGSSRVHSVAPCIGRRRALRIEQSPLRCTMHFREARTTINTPLHQAGGEHCVSSRVHSVAPCILESHGRRR